MKNYPSKEELEQFYIIENHSLKALKEHFKLGMKTIYKLLSEYNLQKTDEQKRDCIKQTMLSRYGVENAAHLQSAIDKRKQTNLERYGSISPFGSKEVQQKTKETFKNKYGCHPRSTIEVQDKQKQTCLAKYGVDNVSKVGEIKERISEAVKLANQNQEVVNKKIETNREKYGVDWYTQQHLTERTLKILSCPQNFVDYLQSLPVILRNKKHISEDLGVHTTNIGPKLHEWGLESLINYNPLYSAGQVGVMQLLDDWGVSYIANDRQVIAPQEIDIYIPSMHMGIEFNGNYTHRDDNKGKEYHLNKSKRANDRGIFIYHLFQYEWENGNTKSRIISQLRNLLGLNHRKIGARQCQIKEIENATEVRHFLDNWHVQGADRAPIRLGLYYKAELVAMMTFSKPRFNKQYQYELSRFCCKGDCTVAGGASKLFKYFLKTYQPESIISYSDNCKTRGSMYAHLGFTLDHESHPNYVWCKRHRVLTRYQCQKHKLIEKFPEYEGLSETEIMTMLDWYKIHDCGNKVWTYNKLL